MIISANDSKRISNMVQQKYYLDRHENIFESIRRSEKEFHKNHLPLYANYLFGNKMTMHKIEKWLNDDESSIGLTASTFADESINNIEMLNNKALSCGLELVDGKVNFEVNYQIAKYSHNAFVYCLESLYEDDLILVRDETLSDNTFILKYIPDDDSDDENEVENLPDTVDVEIPKLSLIFV